MNNDRLFLCNLKILVERINSFDKAKPPIFVNVSGHIDGPVVTDTESSVNMKLMIYKACTDLLHQIEINSSSKVFHIGLPLPIDVIPFTGWILEYPFIYYLVDTEKNCLADVPLKLIEITFRDLKNE